VKFPVIMPLGEAREGLGQAQNILALIEAAYEEEALGPLVEGCTVMEKDRIGAVESHTYASRVVAHRLRVLLAGEAGHEYADETTM
jgi:hypothetical protein